MRTIVIFVAIIIAAISAFALFPSQEVMPSKIDKLKMARDSAMHFEAKTRMPEVTKNMIILSPADLIGNWCGYMESPDSILHSYADEYYYPWEFTNVAVDSIVGQRLFGHAFKKQERVQLTGMCIYNDGKYVLSLSHDQFPEFNFSMHINEADSIMEGNRKLSSNQRSESFELAKRLFEYNPNHSIKDYDWPFMVNEDTKEIEGKYFDEEEGDTVRWTNEGTFTAVGDFEKFNASTERLSEDYVSNLKKGDIIVLRNSIFARHGYIFSDNNLTAFFSEFSWYVPVQSNVAGELTDIELANIDLLLRYEEHAEAYYDVFGR